jgi:hypothetical protein
MVSRGGRAGSTGRGAGMSTGRGGGDAGSGGSKSVPDV